MVYELNTILTLEPIFISKFYQKGLLLLKVSYLNSRGHRSTTFKK